MKKKVMKWMSHWKHVIIPGFVAMGIMTMLIMKTPVAADNGDRAAKGALFGGLTGAAIGGAAGGGKGAGIGLGAGLIGGALIGGATGNGGGYDPYRQLDKEQAKLNKLQDRYARAKSAGQQASLERQLQLQSGRVQDMQRRLQRPAGY